MSSYIQEQYPWASSPLIASAAMGGFSGPALATAVSRAGGIGCIGAINDMEKLAEK
jgi:nitronate monooxygenase